MYICDVCYKKNENNPDRSKAWIEARYAVRRSGKTTASHACTNAAHLEQVIYNVITQAREHNETVTVSEV